MSSAEQRVGKPANDGSGDLLPDGDQTNETPHKLGVTHSDYNMIVPGAAGRWQSSNFVEQRVRRNMRPDGAEIHGNNSKSACGIIAAWS